MSAKKLELPAYDPRGMQGQGLLYATSNKGGCHMSGNMLGPEVLGLPRLIDRLATQGKAGIVARHQDSAAVLDSLVVCPLANLAVSEEYFARLLTAVSGMPFTAGDLTRVGERVYVLERLYNLREGFTRADDTLPPRLLDEPVPAGPSAGYTFRLEPMLQEYYAFRGWDRNGVLHPETLKTLELTPCLSHWKETPLLDQRLYEEFRDIGRDIFVTGMTSTHGGNMSVRVGDRIIIKRRGAQFGRLKPTDFVETGLYADDSGVMRASSELIVHRAIYLKTPALAVIHCHPRTAIALSRDAIIPIDAEGSYVLHKVPVIVTEHASGSPEMAELLSDMLREYKIVMQRGHGCFSTGQMLEEALQWVSTLEESSDVILEHTLLGEAYKEFRRHSKSYSRW